MPGEDGEDDAPAVVDGSDKDWEDDGPVVVGVRDERGDCGGEAGLGGDRDSGTEADLESRQSITWRTMERRSSSVLRDQS